MTDVGISGGMLLKGMGTPAEVAAFFALIDRNKAKSSDGALVEQLEESRRILEQIQIADGFWNELKLGDRAVGLDRLAKTAADAFRKIFQSLDKAIDYARDDKENIGYFRPLRLMAWEGSCLMNTSPCRWTTSKSPTFGRSGWSESGGRRRGPRLPR